MIVRQHELRDERGHHLVCWLEQGLRPGVELTLDEMPGRRWRVIAAYGTAVEKQTLHRPWRVGGL